MNLNSIIAQCLAFLGLGSNIASVQCKRRIWVLFFQISANVLYAVQYIFLDAWPAFATSIVSAVECLIVYYYANQVLVKKVDKNISEDSGRVKSGKDNNVEEGKMPLPVLLLIILATIGFGLLDYKDTLSLLPIAVTIAYSWVVWQPNLKIFRAVSVLIPACWFIYNMHVGAWVSMCTAVVEFGSAIAAVIRIDILDSKDQTDKSDNSNKNKATK